MNTNKQIYKAMHNKLYKLLFTSNNISLKKAKLYMLAINNNNLTGDQFYKLCKKLSMLNINREEVIIIFNNLKNNKLTASQFYKLCNILEIEPNHILNNLQIKG